MSRVQGGVQIESKSSKNTTYTLSGNSGMITEHVHNVNARERFGQKNMHYYQCIHYAKKLMQTKW